MGLFDKLKDKKDDGKDAKKDVTNAASTKEGNEANQGFDHLAIDFMGDGNNEESAEGASDSTVGTDNTVSNNEGSDEGNDSLKQEGEFYDGTLQEEIVDVIGQGSQDVKNLIVTTKTGEEVKFVVAGGVIKQVTSDEGFNIPARLDWVDVNRYSELEIEKACEIFETHDYFDALTALVLSEDFDKDEYGSHNEELGAIISKAHGEESIRTLVRFSDAEVDRIDIDWSVDSDADSIESYSGFSLNPADVADTIESFNLEADSKLHEIGAENLLYPTTNTSYEDAKTDEERYVVAAVFSEFEQRTSDEPGAAGTEIATLVQYAHGFSIVEILDTVLELLENNILSYDDPFEDEPEEEELEEEVSPEPEVLPEEEEPEEEEDFEELEDYVDNEYNEYMQDIAQDNFKPYPAAIEGGTENLGGSLVHYINELRAWHVFTDAADSEVEYNISYNTLYEENVQSVEFSLKHVVSALEASKRVYGGFESIGGQSTDRVSKNSNLYRAAYLVETERNNLNNARVSILKDLRGLLEDISEEQSNVVRLAIAEIDNKLDSIEDVKDVVMGEGAAQFVALDDVIYTPENTPLFYQVAKELGIEVA